MPIQRSEAGKHSVAHIWTADIEPAALKQVQQLADMPFVYPHVAVMPDVHAGRGSTIGSVIPTQGAIIPAAVGVDIACGIYAVPLELRAEDLPDNLRKVRAEIEQRVPHGRTDRGGAGDRGAWAETPPEKLRWWADHGVERQLAGVLERHPQLLRGTVNTHRHLGTLGTGNHFIEVCLDEAGQVWVMLHSGSRGIGNRIGTYFIQRALEECQRWYVPLPDKDLAFLPQHSPLFDDYLAAVLWAQNFAWANRTMMMHAVLEGIAAALDRGVATAGEGVHCHHNYVEMENHYGKNVWVTRKGAVRAREGDMGIIPGSMGAQSYIVRGKGNALSLCSCSHGAGRRMSRTRARAMYTAEDLANQTTGVECPKDAERVDEIPAAYKSIDEVMANQTDLVDVVYTLSQVVNVKG